MRWLNEARWHDELWEPLALEGAEHLRDSTGGTLVVFLHHGPFPLIGPTLAAAGRRLEVVATSDLIHPKLPWQRRTHEIASRGCELFDVAEGSAGVQARLERGAAVVVACDVPGRTPVRFVGRDVVGSSGAVRVAWSLGVPVIGCTMHRDEDGSPFYRLDSALDPADYASTEDLLQELLSRQEEAVLAWPEAYYDPLTKWSTAPHLLRGSS